MMILKCEVLDNEEDIAMLGLSKYERFWKALRKRKGTEPKLDLVLRALLHCGANVDFQKIEAGIDGSAAMHTAAETGALDMIDWLLKKGKKRKDFHGDPDDTVHATLKYQQSNTTLPNTPCFYYRHRY
jgi:hypothetical protein